MKKIIFLLILACATVANAQTPDFQTWKTVQLGQIGTHSHYYDLLRQNNIFITIGNGRRTEDEIERTKFVSEPFAITLVIVSGEDLGIKRDHVSCNFMDSVIKKAAEFGLMPCPVEAALQLRLDWNDQRTDNWVEVVIDPTHTFVLAVPPCGEYAGLPHIYFRGVSGTCFGEEDLFIFMLPPNG